MYLINYNTGAVQYTDDKDLNDWVNGLTTGIIVNVIDAKEKRALIKNSNNEIGWAEIPLKKKYTDEELSSL